VLAAAALASAPTARADVGETIIQRCTHGQSLAGFSQSAYRQALKQLSADAEEYTNCAQLIRQAQLAAAGGHAGALGAPESAVAIAATPTEQRAVSHAAHAGAVPVSVGGALVKPGVVHADIASAFNNLPDSLLALLVFLLACAALIGGRSLRNRIRGHRPD
jgi:hypothetical protein